MKPLKPEKKAKKFLSRILGKSFQKKSFSAKTGFNHITCKEKGCSPLQSKYTKIQINLASQRIWNELEQMEIKSASKKGSTITKVEEKRASMVFDKAFELLKEQMIRRN